MSPKLTARIVEWDDHKGYGFASFNGDRVFVHIREFTARHKAPEVGDTIHFSLGEDRSGRTCATKVQFAGNGRPTFPAAVLVVLAALLVAPVWALFKLSAGYGYDLRVLIAWVLTTSLAAFCFLRFDKRRAQQAGWRLREAVLSLWAVLGGWPGAFLGQWYFRHKTAKLNYQFEFWLIVIVHQYAAIDCLLDWRYTKQVTALFLAWLDAPGT